MDLSTEHDTGEQGEEKAFKHSKQCEDEGQGAGHNGIAALKVLPNTTEEEPGHHSKTKHSHWHDVELQSSTSKFITMSETTVNYGASLS